MIIALPPGGVARHSAKRLDPRHRGTKVLLVDNGDSLTAHLDAACRAGGAAVELVGNDVAPEAAYAYAIRHHALIMLSPGPAGPREAGCCMELIALAAGRVPVVGICLGHQAIVLHHGGRVVRAHEPCRGQSSVVEHDGGGPFAGLPSPMRVGRFHDLCTPLNDVPDGLRVHALLDGMAMAVSHRAQGQIGLQFHPESTLTPLGTRLLDATLDWAEERRRAFAGLTANDATRRVAA